MPKKIVILADGTGNTVGHHDSNVLRLFKMLDYAEEHGQLALYHPGVGTMASVEELKALQTAPRMLVITDEALRSQGERCREKPFGILTGAGTDRNICHLYTRLIERYDPGDTLYIFGFSRGAFTARALAGVIYRVGVLRRDCAHRIGEALQLCQQHFEACPDAKSLYDLKMEVEQFKNESSHRCNIRFLGVWDTVKSVGYVFPRNLPHTRHNPIIETVRHALAMSERRSFYAHTTWGGLDADTRPAIYVPAQPVTGPDTSIKFQDVQEVWFAGDHSNVGGGRALTDLPLANVTLHWMVNEARAAGLCFVKDAYCAILPKPEALSPSDVHDEMKMGTAGWKFIWWLLEKCPRRDITNEPPPPKLSGLWPRSLGPRQLAPTARRGVVSVHITAKRCYEPECAPWKDAPFKFVDTIEGPSCPGSAKTSPSDRTDVFNFVPADSRSG